MKKGLSLLLTVLLLAGLLMPASADAPAADLTFSGSGTFRILHLTDTQDDQYPARDMLNLLRKTIIETDPDLIVFTGDLVEDSRIGDLGIDDESLREGVVVKKGGEIDHDATLANIVTAADAVLQIFEESGLPYAIAQGNNDHKCGITDAEWLEIYSRYPHCLVTDMSDDEGGEIDYNLPIKNAEGKTLFNLWFMDTGRHSVSDQQIAWYVNASAEMTAQNGGTPVPALVFQHVEVDEIGKLFVPCKPWEDGATGLGGKFVRLNRDVAKGNYTFAYPAGDTPEFAAWKACGDVIGAFFGHEHVEGFSGTVDGIELGFTYGCEMAKTGPYGCRVITLHEDDLTNYSNEVYVYTGKTDFGTDKLIQEFDPAPTDTGNPIMAVLGAIKNMAVSLVFWVISLFR